MSTRFPLIVEFLMANAHIAGFVDLQDERRRLVDLLTTSESMLEVTNAQVFIGTSEAAKRLDTLSISKAAILAAVPRETDEHSRVRALQRTVVGRSSTSQGRMAIFLPPLTVEGVAHAPGGANRLKADPAVFSHFFSVTDADLTAPYGELRGLPVVVVNRDAIAAMSMLAEVFKAGDPRAASRPMDRAFLDKLVSNL